MNNSVSPSSHASFDDMYKTVIVCSVDRRQSPARQRATTPATEVESLTLPQPDSSAEN